MGRLSRAELMLRDARRRRLGFPEPMRVVPSKRGLLTVFFLAAAAAGASAGLLALHLLHVCS